MRYEVTGDFVKIGETTGTIQNTSSVYAVEVSHKAEEGSGIILYPLNKFSFNDATIYLRCIDTGGRAEIRVSPFAVDSGGSSSGGGASSTVDSDFATDDEYAAMMDDIWNGGGSATVDSDDGFSEELDNIFGN